MLVGYGDSEGLRARADDGDQLASMLMPDLIARRRQLEGSTQAGAGDPKVVGRVVGDSTVHLVFNPDEWARRPVEPDTAAWDGVMNLATLLADYGNADDAVRILTASGIVRDEDTESAREMLTDYGSMDRQRARADDGDDRAAMRLAAKLAMRGDLEELRARVDAADRWAGGKLPSVLVELGRGKEAERVRQFGLNPDGSVAFA